MIAILKYNAVQGGSVFSTCTCHAFVVALKCVLQLICLLGVRKLTRICGQAIVLANDWMALNPEVRGRVKVGSVMALGSQHNGVRLAAAQVIAKIATIELPKPGQWEDLMQQLLDFVVKPEASPVGIESRSYPHFSML
jgi:hypothetical protein